MTVLSPISSTLPAQRRPAPPVANSSSSSRNPARDTGMAGADQTALRQLRHLTANALQRILSEVAQQDGLCRTPESRRMRESIENRIMRSASLADALFGMTREPGPLPLRLHNLGEAIIGLLGDPDQLLTLDVVAGGQFPAALEDVVVRIAHELLFNAVKHGMHARLIGRISITLASGPRGTMLVVADDGWGVIERPGCKRGHGEGLSLVRALIAPFEGKLDTRSGRDGGFTAEVYLPPLKPVINRKELLSAGHRTGEAT